MDATRLLRLAREAAAPCTEPLDTELLRRYVADRDENAFTELVRRNGPIVLRACRNVLGEAGAEDAFQATFLLLVRSAGRLTRPGALAGWLHAAAVRIARRARRGESRRRRRELGSVSSVSAPDDLTWREVREVLDAELAALPEKYRAPLVLCYLQELSYEAAARQIGCPVGTLRGRLERGKERLRRRLARYGLPLAAPALVLGAPTQVPAALVRATLAAVRAAVVNANVPATAAGLAETRTGLRLVLFAPIAVALAVGAVLAAGAFLTAQPPKIELSKPADSAVTSPSQPPVDRLGDPLPSGAVARLGTRRLFGPHEPRWAAFSPDGTKVAAQNSYGVTVCDAGTGRKLVEQTNYGVVNGAIGWRDNGSGVAVVRLPDQTLFVSTFTDPAEKLPAPPARNPPPAGRGPDELDFTVLSPDATRLATVGDSDAKQLIIDIRPATPGKPVRDLKPLRTLGPFAGPCHDIRYTSRGILFLSGSWKEEGDWTISVVDPDKNVVTRTVTIPAPAYCAWGLMLGLSADGRLAAIPARPKPAQQGAHVINQHDGTIRLWDLEAGKEVGSVPFPKVGYGTGHAFTPDGKKLITSGENPYFQIWDVATGKELIRAPLPNGPFGSFEASAVAVSPDGKRFATARRDGRIDIWDTATAKPAFRLDTHRDVITAVAVSPDGRLAATSGDDTVRVWELPTGKSVGAVPAPRAQANPRPGPRRRPAFTPDGRGLLLPSGEGLALVDPVTSKSLVLPGGLRNAKGAVGGFAADGKTLVTFARDKVTLWDWPAGTVRATVTVPLAPRKETDAEKHPEVVRVDYSSTLSPDGRLLFTNSVREPKDKPDRGGVQNANDVWDVQTGKHLHRLDKPEAWYPPSAFSPDGRVLYLGGHSPEWPERGRRRADALTAWEPAAGKLLRRFGEPDRPERPQQIRDFGRHVEALAVSPDGRLAAVAESITSFDGVWVYEAASGRPLKKFAGHSGDVTDLAFSPDGRRLVTVSADQTGLVWDVTLSALATGPGRRPAAKELADAWERLAGADPGPGYRGVAALAAGADGLALLKERLRPAEIPTDADLDRVVTRFGADAFADRETASAELERFGPNAVAGVKVRMAKAESAEVRDRLARFLGRYAGPHATPYELRCVRGVAALEAIGTPEAKELLARLAKGPAGDVLTREAAAALGRLHRR